MYHPDAQHTTHKTLDVASFTAPFASCSQTESTHVPSAMARRISPRSHPGKTPSGTMTVGRLRQDRINIVK
jgi:hypothetical protein